MAAHNFDFDELNYRQWSPEKAGEYVARKLGLTDELRDKCIRWFVKNNKTGRELAEGHEWLVEMVSDELMVDGRNSPGTLRAAGAIPEMLNTIEGNLMPLLLTRGCKRVPEYDQGYTEDDDFFQHVGESAYINPAGFFRCAVSPSIEGENAADGEKIMKTWHVAYHGTAACNIDSILRDGLLPPGAAVEGGVIEVGHGNAGATSPSIYVSPSIQYASHWVYTQHTSKKGYVAECDFDFDAKDYKPQKEDGKYHTYVLQLRVHPEAYRVQGNTFWKGGWPDRKVPYDLKCCPDELEWLITDPGRIRVTGLMIRRSEVEPREEVNATFAKNREYLTERLAAIDPCPVGVWEWNNLPAGGNVLSSDGPFAAYNAVHSDRIEKAYKAGCSHVFLGGIATEDENRYVYCINFDKMEQARCEPGNAFRRRKVRRRPT